MNAQNWIDVVALVLGGGGMGGGGVAGVKLVAKLTRLVVAVESLGEKLEGMAQTHKETDAKVDDHENRLNRANL